MTHITLNSDSHERSPANDCGTVKIWDPFVRVFHWSLVLAVATALVTGYLLNRSWLNIHVAGGSAVVLLVILRLVWGFTGTRHARFASFIVSPAKTIAHLRELGRGRAHRHLGHNPLGAWMILALLFVLVALGITGVVTLGGLLKSGPLAFALPFADGRVARGIHEILSAGLLGLIGLHLVGTLMESLRSRENLVVAMVTGNKRAEPGIAAPARAVSRPFLAAALMAALIVPSAALVFHGNSLPALGVPQGQLDPVYASECGACHTPYHPSLLPAASWKGIMAGLDEHFGENAQLDAATATKISQYLAQNSSEHFDTLPAHLFARADPADPLRITATPLWKFFHHSIPASVFAAKAVGATGACAACHADATSGHFNPAKISIPEKAEP